MNRQQELRLDKIVITDKTAFKTGKRKTKRWMRKEEKNITSLRKYSKKVNYCGTICKGEKC